MATYYRYAPAYAGSEQAGSAYIFGAYAGSNTNQISSATSDILTTNNIPTSEEVTVMLNVAYSVVGYGTQPFPGKVYLLKDTTFDPSSIVASQDISVSGFNENNYQGMVVSYSFGTMKAADINSVNYIGFIMANDDLPLDYATVNRGLYIKNYYENGTYAVQLQMTTVPIRKLTYNGSSPEAITYNGSSVNKVVYNGATVWTKE